MHETDNAKVQHLQYRLLLQRFVPGENVGKAFVQVL